MCGGGGGDNSIIRSSNLFSREDPRTNVMSKVAARERVYSSGAAEIIFMLTKLNWNTVERARSAKITVAGGGRQARDGGGLKERKDERDFPRQRRTIIDTPARAACRLPACRAPVFLLHCSSRRV